MPWTHALPIAVVALLSVPAVLLSPPAQAHPEFQKFIQTHSGRGVNWAF